MVDTVSNGGKREFIVVVDGEATTVTFDTKAGLLTLSFSKGKRSTLKAMAYEILWAECQNLTVTLNFVNRDGKDSHSLVHIDGTVREDEGADVTELCELIMLAAYPDGVKRRRRFRVLVNPHGGPGRAGHIYSTKVEPMLKAATCVYDKIETEHSKHAQELSKTMPLDTYDAVMVLSGDGLIHEVVNGFGEHEQSARAFSTPIAPVPTGSGNGTSINLLGLEDGFNVGLAVLNAIKGRPMKADICMVTQGDKRIYSFMTQALGLMADLDLGTEHLRWMGDKRFMYGFLRGLILLKPCPVTLSMKVVEQDKEKMAAALRASRDAPMEDASTSTPALGGDPPSDGKAADPAVGDGWITFDKPLVYAYAGKGPYVGRDLMQFPVSQASDGLIDVAIQELTTRGELLGAIDGAEKGGPYWMDSQHHFKVQAYRVTPKSEKGWVAIDGESYPWQPFTVEVQHGLATFLSPHGRYASDFEFGSDREPVVPVNQQDKPGSKIGGVVGCCFPSKAS